MQVAPAGQPEQEDNNDDCSGYDRQLRRMLPGQPP
jgi:hypothetical protein